MGSACRTYGGGHAYRFQVCGHLKERKQLARKWNRREDNIKMYLKRIGWEGVNRCCLAHDMDR
jgi:hypothetical protein